MSIDSISIQFPLKQLTQREYEVLTLAAQGKQRPDIALMLVITQETVKFHIEQICQKLNARNVRQAAAIAVALELIAPFKLTRISEKYISNTPRTGSAPEENIPVSPGHRERKAKELG